MNETGFIAGWRKVITPCRREPFGEICIQVLVVLTSHMMLAARNPILPVPSPGRDTLVTVPDAFQTPHVEGVIDAASECAGVAQLLTMSHHEGSGPIGNCESSIYLVHDEFNPRLAIQANRCGVLGDPAVFEVSNVSLFLAPDFNRAVVVDAFHLQIQADVPSDTIRWPCVDRAGEITASASAPSHQREVGTAICSDDVSWS